MPDESTTAISETVSEWCAFEKISKTHFYKIKREHPELAPKTLEVLGIVRVIESHPSWRARMAEFAKGAAARLESERRREIASIAGKAAAASAAHVSKHADKRRHPRVKVREQHVET